MSLHARGTGADTQHAEGRLDWREGAFADTHGLVAGEDLRARLSWKIDRHGAEQGQGRFTLLWDQGGAYVHPAYIEANPEQPLSLSGNLRWRGNRLSMDELSLQWGDRLALSGMGSMDMSAGASGLQASLQLQQLRFPESYDELLQSFLYATPLDDLQTQGQISGQLRIEAGRPVAASLSIDDMHMDDRKGRLGLYGLEGQLFWDASDAAGPSHLEWSGGHVYRVPLGASSLAIQSRPDGFSMLEPAIIPILDGSLRLDSLRADGISRGQPILELDAQLTPISMTQLAAHLNMPSFAGTLAGSLPGARFEQGRLSMDGVLRVAAFDGEIRMANPSLEDPFGVAPVLTADMEIDDLDLASVTSTFAFGLIEGILRGHVDDLVLVNWQPVNFDAVLYTPLDRQFRRRISQRALDNLVSVGGGPGGALSMGLLRFFDSFGYHQLGISCNLRGDVCEMNGVAPTTDGLGYYIVRGSGLPRVEVIGHTRDVAWRDLLTRLQAALDTPEISSSASPGESGQDRISLQH